MHKESGVTNKIPRFLIESNSDSMAITMVSPEINTSVFWLAGVQL